MHYTTAAAAGVPRGGASSSDDASSSGAEAAPVPRTIRVDGSTAERRATRVGNLATVALLREHAEAAAELAQRQLMMEEDADGDTLGSLSGSTSRKSGRKGGQRSHGRSGRW